MQRQIIFLFAILLMACNKESYIQILSDPIFAELTTTNASMIKGSSAVSGGFISSSGNSDITSRGVCWSTSPDPTFSLSTKSNDGSGEGSFSSNITGLSPNTLYYVRAYANNAAGTAYGNAISFTTTDGAEIPQVTTRAAISISAFSAISGGTIVKDGGASITSRGVCWSTSPNPTTQNSKTSNGTGIGLFSSSLTNLNPGTLYYVRAYATNNVGTGYGNEQIFSTLPLFTMGAGVTDIDGNYYQSIILGNQEWMKENLKVSKYRNGNAIPTNLDNTAWQYTSSGAYATYNNTTYGKLYNWYAVADSRGLCPAGWHVPSNAEWTTLENFLGGDLVAGGKMKSTGTIQAGTGLWKNPNNNATNSSGFTGLPGGGHSFGSSNDIGEYGYWWSSSENSSSSAWSLSLNTFNAISYRYNNHSKPNGFSVRCLRD